MGTDTPIKIFRRMPLSATRRKVSAPSFLMKFRVYLKDKPGSLAAFSSLIADCGGNISFFHYDRAVDSGRVVVEIQMTGREKIDSLLQALTAKKYSFEKSLAREDEVTVTTPENILEIRARLLNKPGSLAAFAKVFKRYHANVLYLFYDEDIDPESSAIALAAEKPGEIDALLEALNRKGYHYRVVYRGSDKKEIEHIIGLKLVEKFFLRLRSLLNESDLEEVRSLVRSSRELSSDLVQFYSETGNNLDAADIFEKVLALASAARGKVGDRFSAKPMPPLRIGDVGILGFRLPTSENIYILTHEDEITMIDSGYGIYYEDLKALLKANSLDPSRVRRIFLTHADADHAGSSGHFAREFGTEVFMHPACREVIEKDNRSHGAGGRLSKLNNYYTRLVNRFTDCRFPVKPRLFSGSVIGRAGVFNIIDTFSIGVLRFEVLESLGGHVPGNVFFLNRDFGLLFTADYLLNIGSLTSEDRDTLNVYKYLLISPNTDGARFKEEMAALGDLMLSFKKEFTDKGRSALIFPGHGDYYPII